MTNLAKSIVMEFPVLFSKTTPNGYEEIFCAKGATGYLAQYVRQKRHRDPFIKKHWTWRKNRVTITNPLSNIDDDERRLRESRPTAVNLSELVQLMHNTREHRRAWINTCNPDATSILNRFPRLFDVNELISKEFAAIAGEFLSLRVDMLSFRQKILVYSENLKDYSNMQQILRAYQSNEFDEDKKTELSLLLLPHILIPPQQRGLKAPRVGRDVVSNLMFVDMNEEQMSVPEAVASLQKKLMGRHRQPPTPTFSS
ncbi:uncharacterized protein LOC124815606 [Hydra vulgaris]|uniref:uncharacterized protein LOC124815606 n=1 Tax=Hydra vulgaris TaxID=6087 RepID=UPI0032E9FEFD